MQEKPSSAIRKSSSMARSPITASKEGDVTSANEETLPFDDDNLKGEAHYAANNFLPANALTYLAIYSDVRVIILSSSHFIQSLA